MLFRDSLTHDRTKVIFEHMCVLCFIIKVVGDGEDYATTDGKYIFVKFFLQILFETWVNCFFFVCLLFNNMQTKI